MSMMLEQHGVSNKTAWRCCKKLFWSLILFGLHHSVVWAVTASGSRSSHKKQPRFFSRSHPLYQGILWSRQAEWSKAKAFFLKVKKEKLLQLKREDRPLLYLFLGLSYLHLLERSEGKLALESALLLDECTKLPSFLDLSPQIRGFFGAIQRPFERLCTQRKIESLKKQLDSQKKLVAKKLKESHKAQKKKTKLIVKIPTQKQKQRSIRLAAWLVMGSGSLALGSAFVAGGMSLTAEFKRNEQAYTPKGTLEYLRLHHLAGQRALVANVLFVSAGVLLFTGFALHLSQLFPAAEVLPSKASSAPQTKLPLFFVVK